MYAQRFFESWGVDGIVFTYTKDRSSFICVLPYGTQIGFADTALFDYGVLTLSEMYRF